MGNQKLWHCPTRMTSWNNPLPIGQSAESPIGEGSCASRVSGIKYSRLPSHSGVIAPQEGPVDPRYIYYDPPPPITTRSPNFLLPTTCVLYFPPTTPTYTPSAHIVILGHIGGNNPQRQGQRHPHQSLGQWNTLFFLSFLASQHHNRFLWL